MGLFFTIPHSENEVLCYSPFLSSFSPTATHPCCPAQNVVELLDDLFQRAAAADEPPELNFIRQHALKMQGQGLDNAAARLFSNPAGDYGSMVNERVGAGSWENGDELGDTWAR